MSTLRLALLATMICLVQALPTILDFRPAVFARKRYLNSRMQAKGRQMSSNLTAYGLDFMALVQREGYPAEEHRVVTADGYKLTLHRIPGSPTNPKAKGKPVIFMQHGLAASSDSWILLGPSNDLAYMLADSGFDVWLGNARGNTYSRSHVKLSPDYHPKFWQFSFHEIAVYDLPASIDYILHMTNQKSLVYVGHSMGTTASFILLSTKPEYNDKISLVISLAPVAYWHAPPTPFLRFLKSNADAISAYLINAKMYEILPLTSATSQMAIMACRDKSLLQVYCLNLLYFSSGYNPSQLNATGLEHFFSVFPAGGSTQTVVHYGQNIKSGDFQMFDYGTRMNLFKYKQTTPPLYNVSNIVAPVALIYGKGDALVPEGNALELASKLPNVVAVEAIPDPRFSHMDFLFAKDVKELLNNRLMKLTSNYLRTNDV